MASIPDDLTVRIRVDTAEAERAIAHAVVAAQGREIAALEERITRQARTIDDFRNLLCRRNAEIAAARETLERITGALKDADEARSLP